MIDFFNELEVKANRLAPIHKGDSIWIKCPFHGNGEERTPSCRINMVKGAYPIGFFHCYGCGTNGNWNDLAKALDLTPLSEEEIKHQESLLVPLSKAQTDSFYNRDDDTLQMMTTMIDWDNSQTWRTVNGDLLNKIGAKLMFSNRKELKLFLPCYQNKSLNGGIQALLERKQGEVGYIYTKGSWVKKTLFPFDYVKSIYREYNSTVALVEGSRDALRLIQHGLPALAILGSQNWSEKKANLIKMMNPKKIVMAFDGDRAGEHAYDIVMKSFTGFKNIYKIDFEQGQDPADLTKEQVSCIFDEINNS
jgi:DNA primase